jgi:hypothetical protein
MVSAGADLRTRRVPVLLRPDESSQRLRHPGAETEALNKNKLAFNSIEHNHDLCHYSHVSPLGEMSLASSIQEA